MYLGSIQLWWRWFGLAARSTAAGKVWAAVIEQLNPTDRGGVGGTAQAGSPTIIIHPTLKLKNIES